MRNTMETLLSVSLGALLAHLFWRERFRETRTADYYREVLAKLISPFYLWLLYGRIKTQDRRLDTNVSQEELKKIIIFSEGDDKKIVKVLKNSVHLAAVDRRLFNQVKEFLSCYEFNYGLKETREKIFNIYRAMESLFNEYSEEYKNIMMLRKIPFYKRWNVKTRRK